MSKRSFDIASLTAKRAKMESVASSTGGNKGGGGGVSGSGRKNPYLSNPIQPERSLHQFLMQVRNTARNYLPKEELTKPITKAFCEVEARLGILKIPHAIPNRRVTSSGAKHIQNTYIKAFDCSTQQPKCIMESGVSRTHFTRWTSSGNSESSPLSQAFGIANDSIKKDLIETEMIETVYLGYSNDARVCFPGIHPPPPAGSEQQKPSIGTMESKAKLSVMDLTIPSAPYDFRITLSSEKIMNPAITSPPSGYKAKRIKRRRSYTRRDKSIAWQIDVTEVTTTNAMDSNSHAQVDYEIEMELRENVLLQLINEKDDNKLKQMTHSLSQQLWWIITQINPLMDALDVDEYLHDHPNKSAVQLALATCGALKRYMESRGSNRYECPIGKGGTPNPSLGNISFPGCMPINFSRHNLEDIQKGSDNAYYLSEKTDGVRYLMVFTGDTVVLVDRAMRGKQPLSTEKQPLSTEPFESILSLIKPGTVFDGEVVMNRRGGGGGGNNKKPRPIFIVFDVMAISTTEPVLQLPFEQRLQHLKRATFRTVTANRDMFANPNMINDLNIPLPLVRKNFVKRTDLDDLLSHVIEERGMRCYRNGELHNHLTDGIIFQPNLPYVCGTDRNLLKWKYLDTVTIDVELLPLRHNDDDDTLRVGCMGEEQTSVDMTRHILLPKAERMKLEADKFDSKNQMKTIAEVGFDPETGEWYYLTLRPDKIAPNHISTVLGTLLELGECLTADELRFRMSVLPGSRDTYRKDMRGMLKQLMEHQRRKLQKAKTK